MKGTMLLRQDIKPITFLKTRAAELIGRLNRDRRPVIITQSGEPRAIVLDPVSYDEMRTALGLMRLMAQSERDIRLGRIVPQDEVFSRLAKKLNREQANEKK